MKYIPLFCRVIVKINEKNKNFEMFSPALKNDIATGKVIAISNGIDTNGKEIKIQVKVGDNVIFNKFGAIKIDTNKNYYLLNQSDILIKFIK